MQNYVYISEGDLQAWVIVTLQATGKWEAFAFFEMCATDNDEIALVTKRRIGGEFRDEEEAEITACAFALNCMRRWAHQTASIQYLQEGTQGQRLPCPVI